MSIKEFEGENVFTSVSQLRTSISRLTLLKKLPADIVKRLLLIFQKKSVSEFNDLFRRSLCKGVSMEVAVITTLMVF